MIKESKPDGIILDVMMPKESGLKLYREIKSNENTSQIPGNHVFGGIKKCSFIRTKNWTVTMVPPSPNPTLILKNPLRRRSC